MGQKNKQPGVPNANSMASAVQSAQPWQQSEVAGRLKGKFTQPGAPGGSQFDQARAVARGENSTPAYEGGASTGMNDAANAVQGQTYGLDTMNARNSLMQALGKNLTPAAPTAQAGVGRAATPQAPMTAPVTSAPVTDPVTTPVAATSAVRDHSQDTSSNIWSPYTAPIGATQPTAEQQSLTNQRQARALASQAANPVQMRAAGKVPGIPPRPTAFSPASPEELAAQRAWDQQYGG